MFFNEKLALAYLPRSQKSCQGWPVPSATASAARSGLYSIFRTWLGLLVLDVAVVAVFCGFLSLLPIFGRAL
jgi:hypothetical protein